MAMHYDANHNSFHSENFLVTNIILPDIDIFVAPEWISSLILHPIWSVQPHGCPTIVLDHVCVYLHLYSSESVVALYVGIPQKQNDNAMQ